METKTLSRRLIKANLAMRGKTMASLENITEGGATRRIG